MKKLILMIGPAQSGKSTYARQFHKDFNIVSADEIRFKMLDSSKTGIYFNRSIEKEVWKRVFANYERLLKGEESIVFDATNLTFNRRYPIVARARKAGYEINFVWFKIPFSVLMLREGTRKRKVSEEVLMRQYLALQEPEGWEYDGILIVNGKCPYCLERIENEDFGHCDVCGKSWQTVNWSDIEDEN